MSYEVKVCSVARLLSYAGRTEKMWGNIANPIKPPRSRSKLSIHWQDIKMWFIGEFFTFPAYRGEWQRSVNFLHPNFLHPTVSKFLGLCCQQVLF
jgi:hypothetical protein